MKKTIFSLLLAPIMFFGQATEIAKKGIRSTVSIVALDKISQPLGYGSGFIIDDETVVTNVHVIEGCNSAYVLLNGQEKKYSVSGYVAIDKANDLVILKVSGLYGTALNIGAEELPEIGDKIYAVGNPKGLNGTFSEGIISGVRSFTNNQVLQITAPISPGSSGGPVLNSYGDVVGIAFASFSAGQNLNFAIPVKYLTILKSKIGTITSLSTVKAQPKTNSANSVSPNIKEGVTVRNVKNVGVDGNGTVITNFPYDVSFSIKNNLQSLVSDIKILVLVYDNTGTVIDYKEETFMDFSGMMRWAERAGDKSGVEFYKKEYAIRPNLAKQMKITFENGTSSVSYVKARVLDFRIIEE